MKEPICYLSIYINTYTKKRKKNLNTDVIFLK